MNSIKEKIKRIPGAKKLITRIKSSEIKEERALFFKNYMYSSPKTKEKLDYELLLEIHKIEKGLASINPRPFGKEKIKQIIVLLELNRKFNYENRFTINYAMSTLKKYVDFYKEQGWEQQEEYNICIAFFKKDYPYESIESGAFLFNREEALQNTIDYTQFIKARRSVRTYSNIPLKDEDVKKAVEAALLSPSACNRQMCKIYQISKERNIIVEKYAQGLGLFDLSNANYFIVTFDLSFCYFFGERNQGYFNAGLMSMNFVNSLHSLGIGSCFVQFGNTLKEEKRFKSELNIPNSERIAVIIVAGYYAKESKIPRSSRKSIDDIYLKI